MSEEHDDEIMALSRAAVPPLPATLRQRTLAMARSNVRLGLPRARPWAFADYVPPLVLVPSLLISAGAAFVVDAFIKMVRLFWA